MCTYKGKLSSHSSLPLLLLVAERILIGGVAGAIAQGSIYPLEVIQTRLAVSPVGTYSGILDAAAKIMRHEGSHAFFR